MRGNFCSEKLLYRLCKIKLKKQKHFIWKSKCQTRLGSCKRLCRGNVENDAEKTPSDYVYLQTNNIQ